MSDWWTYRPSDFLLFSPRVYERLIESHNAGLWPWQLVALALGLAALGLAALGLAWRGRPADGRIALALCGAGLAGAAAFLWGRYASINWVAGYFAPAIAATGALAWLIAAVLRAPLRIGRDVSAGLALALIALGVIFYPLYAPVFGRPIAASQIAGVMPDPTALAALGLAALVRGRAAAALAAVPLLWALYATVTLWTLGAPETWLMLTGLALFAAASLARLSRGARRNEPERPRVT